MANESLWPQNRQLLTTDFAVQFNRRLCQFAKRCMDVLAAATVLFLLWPLMLLIAVAIRLDSRGPANFVQKKVGTWWHANRLAIEWVVTTFDCLKFPP